MANVKITVKRAFCIAGIAQEVNSTLEVAQALAVELISNGKAEIAEEKPSKSKKAASDTDKEIKNESI